MTWSFVTAPAIVRGAGSAALSFSCLAVVSPGAAGASPGDPWADAVVSFSPGNGDPAYGDPATALGSPERMTGEGIFPGVVSPFNPPWGTDEIVSIGPGGHVVVSFDEPVTDDPGNPFGIDLLVFGNTSFLDVAWPAGIVGGLFGDDGGTIEVSLDGVAWVAVSAAADGPWPPAGYLDSGAYDEVAGTIETDFTRPVDPALTLADFIGLDVEGVLALYDGSGGGTGIDLAPTGLAAIRFVRITNEAGGFESIEIDAVADVTATPSGDLDGDGLVGVTDLLVLLAAWGECPAPPLTCPADLDGDGAVGVTDLLVVLAAWS